MADSYSCMECFCGSSSHDEPHHSSPFSCLSRHILDLPPPPPPPPSSCNLQITSESSMTHHSPPSTALACRDEPSGDDNSSAIASPASFAAAGASLRSPRQEGGRASRRRKHVQTRVDRGGAAATSEAGRKRARRSEDPEAARYIHVRARRGQATDRHSLAERVRRGKISERMRLLQSLVPGCDRVAGKAVMLDQIINYVQSLKTQVEFLSMKLATMDQMLYDHQLEMDISYPNFPELPRSASAVPSGEQMVQCSGRAGQSGASVPQLASFDATTTMLLDAGAASELQLTFSQQGGSGVMNRCLL